MRNQTGLADWMKVIAEALERTATRATDPNYAAAVSHDINEIAAALKMQAEKIREQGTK